MFQETPTTTSNPDENRYLKKFEQEFLAIMKEVSMYTAVIPQYKSENESLRERLTNIREWVEVASKLRYLPGADSDAVLANLIANVLPECSAIEVLKPIVPVEPDIKSASDDLFQMLATSRGVNMDEAFSGFDFFENNPYKKLAEKRIAKIRKKKAR